MQVLHIKKPEYYNFVKHIKLMCISLMYFVCNFSIRTAPWFWPLGMETCWNYKT